jgi:hypothetical protein
MYFFLASYPILGAGLKFIDDAFDEKRYSIKSAYILAPLLGILWAYSMIISPVSATILLAILIGVILKGKIDNYAHLVGLGIILGIIVVAGVELLIIPLIVLTIAALFDEVGNDLIEKKEYLHSKDYLKKFIGFFFDQRWLTKVAVLSIAIIGVIPSYFFLAMILFDGAYLFVRWFSNSKQQIEKSVVEKDGISTNIC